jgi:hypothetical protein
MAAKSEGYKEAPAPFGIAAVADTSTVIGIGICVIMGKPH